VATAIRCLAATYYDGFHIKPHRHHWGQLIYAGSGMMRVRSGGTVWIVPPARAVWLPAGTEHEIHGLGDFAMRTLYFPVAMTAALPNACCAIDVPPLFRELVLELVERCPIDDGDQAGMRMTVVTLDLLARAAVLPLQLPLPRDPRALHLAERLQADPCVRPSCLNWRARLERARERSSDCSLPRPGFRSAHGASACACSMARVYSAAGCR